LSLRRFSAPTLAAEAPDEDAERRATVGVINSRMDVAIDGEVRVVTRHFTFPCVPPAAYPPLRITLLSHCTRPSRRSHLAPTRPPTLRSWYSRTHVTQERAQLTLRTWGAFAALNLVLWQLKAACIMLVGVGVKLVVNDPLADATAPYATQQRLALAVPVATTFAIALFDRVYMNNRHHCARELAPASRVRWHATTRALSIAMLPPIAARTHLRHTRRRSQIHAMRCAGSPRTLPSSPAGLFCSYARQAPPCCPCAPSTL
jgi:hypothetical protein